MIMAKKLLINRIGETNINSKGISMKIIEYIDSNNIVVQFENGITTFTRYEHFLNGNVACSNKIKRAHLRNAMKKENNDMVCHNYYGDTKITNLSFEDFIDEIEKLFG